MLYLNLEVIVGFKSKEFFFFFFCTHAFGSAAVMLCKAGRVKGEKNREGERWTRVFVDFDGK